MTVAGNGMEALTALQAGPFDLVLKDEELNNLLAKYSTKGAAEPVL